MERRAHRRVINLFPACSLTEHGRALDFSSPKGKYILNKMDTANCEDLLATTKLIKNKIKNLKDNHKPIDLKHPKNKTIFLAAKRLGLELPQENKILVEQLLSQLSAFEKNINIEIKGLVDKLISLKDMIENKEENTKCGLQLAEIRKIQDSIAELTRFEDFAACMLEQMRKIVDSGFEYDLHTHNCSTTALSILKADREGKVKEVSPAKVFTAVTPQIVYNTAVAFRDNACGISASQSLINLDIFYIDRAQNNSLTVKSRKCANVHDAIMRFAVDNIFPEKSDERDNIFYFF